MYSNLAGDWSHFSSVGTEQLYSHDNYTQMTSWNIPNAIDDVINSSTSWRHSNDVNILEMKTVMEDLVFFTIQPTQVGV